jgi:nitrite reductase/ring-hydroxylating ferredoxin subunit/uncharacterized membrane protein
MTVGLAERDMADMLAEQAWLEPVDEAVNKAVSAGFEALGSSATQVKNFLHGTWLGHPLHPALTDVPIGAWATALALDALEALGRDELGPGADAAIGFGLLGAVGAALAGLTDWQVTGGRARRVGLVHGLLNMGVAGIYTASLISRRRGARGTGRTLATLGFALANYTAFLGGDLVYRERIGVDHSLAPGQSPPTDFTPVLAEADLAEGQLRAGEANGFLVLLVRQGGQLYALGDTCAHLGCSLAKGHLEGDSVRCWCHGSRFALADGRVLDGPATMPQPTFETRVRDGQVEVRATAD